MFKKRLAVAVATVATVGMLAACGSNDGEETAPSPSESNPVVPDASTTSEPPEGEESVTPMQPVREAPEIPDEMGEDAAAATAQNFLESWMTFSPSDLEPKKDWFNRWEDMTSAEFRSDMRIQADGMWSWTWNQSKKSCCVVFEGEPEVEVGEHTAAAKVTFKRYKQDLFATSRELEDGDGLEEETLTYIVAMSVEDERYEVIDAYLADDDESLPEVR